LIFRTSFISHQLNAMYRVTKVWWPYSNKTDKKYLQAVLLRLC